MAVRQVERLRAGRRGAGKNESASFSNTVKSGIVVIGSKVRHSFHKILNGRRGIIFELSTFNQKQSPL